MYHKLWPHDLLDKPAYFASRFRSMCSYQFMLAWADMVCHKYLAIGGIFTLVRSREVLADSGRLPK